MKKSIIFILTVGILAVFMFQISGACEKNSSAKVEKTVLSVSGMKCQHCADKIKSLLTKTGGVKSASVSFADSRAEVEYSSDQVTIEQLVQIVNSTEFKACDYSGASHTSGEGKACPVKTSLTSKNDKSAVASMAGKACCGKASSTAQKAKKSAKVEKTAI